MRIIKFSELFLRAIIEIETFGKTNEKTMNFLIYNIKIFFTILRNLLLRMNEFWNLFLRKGQNRKNKFRKNFYRNFLPAKISALKVLERFVLRFCVVRTRA